MLLSCTCFSWCRLHHQRKVSGVSVILLEGLSQAHFYRHYLHFKHLRTKYTSVSQGPNGTLFPFIAHYFLNRVPFWDSQCVAPHVYQHRTEGRSDLCVKPNYFLTMVGVTTADLLSKDLPEIKYGSFFLFP